MKTPDLISQHHDLHAQERALTEQIAFLEKQLRPHEKAFGEAMNTHNGCVDSLQPVYQRRASDAKEAMERERELIKPLQSRLVELKEDLATVRAAIADLAQGASTRLILAKALYGEAEEHLKQITQELTRFQARLAALKTAVAQGESKVARLSAERDKALTTETMTAASAALTEAARELESAHLLQRNTDRKVAELIGLQKAATQALEAARCAAWSAKAADLMDGLRSAHLGAFAAAFAANVAAGKGSVRFADFVSKSISSADWVLPDLEGHQQRLAADLGIPVNIHPTV